MIPQVIAHQVFSSNEGLEHLYIGDECLVDRRTEKDLHLDPSHASY